jgi:pyruvate dehydrogenase E1 component beta subunit
MTIKTFTYAWMEALAQEMRKNPNLITIWQNSVRSATLPTGEVIDLVKEFGPLRSWIAPIDEFVQNFAGIGATLAGTPVHAQIPSMTTLLTVEPIFQQAAKLRYQSGGTANLPMVFQIQGLARIEGRGGVHEDVGAEFVYAGFPGLIVVVPSNAYDAKGLMVSALRSPDPVVYFNYTEASATPGMEVPDEAFTIPFGKANILQEGKDLTIVAWAPAILDVKKAMDGIKKAGISAEVIDLRSIKPWDSQAVLASVKKTGRLLVVDHGCYTNSFSSHVLAEAYQFVPGSKGRKITFPDAWGPSPKEMIYWMRPDAPKIVDAAQKMMKL